MGILYYLILARNINTFNSHSHGSDHKMGLEHRVLRSQALWLQIGEINSKNNESRATRFIQVNTIFFPAYCLLITQSRQLKFWVFQSCFCPSNRLCSQVGLLHYLRCRALSWKICLSLHWVWMLGPRTFWTPCSWHLLSLYHSLVRVRTVRLRPVEQAGIQQEFNNIFMSKIGDTMSNEVGKSSIRLNPLPRCKKEGPVSA